MTCYTLGFTDAGVFRTLFHQSQPVEEIFLIYLCALFLFSVYRYDICTYKNKPCGTLGKLFNSPSCLVRLRLKFIPFLSRE